MTECISHRESDISRLWHFLRLLKMPWAGRRKTPLLDPRDLPPHLLRDIGFCDAKPSKSIKWYR